MGLACSGLLSGGDAVVAIEFVNPPDSIRVNDTVVIQVRALNRSGDSIPNAVIFIYSQNPDTMAVDSARMAVVGKKVGQGRLVAVSNGLPTAPLPIPVK